MKPVFLVKTSGKMSLAFQTCSMASEEFKPLFGMKCRIIFEGFIDKSLSLYTTAIRFFLNVDYKYTTINCC